ncbi:MAG: aminotransferase class V-fold PLP-dependent enzyme, partial [Kangiellaceae bacterium]|nr:aminotransferase class V-fold PLP-dependent enzyme [Kangiellaceae bacterium]
MQSPWKSHFPALNNSKITYFDSAATTQVPQAVIDSISHYLSSGCANPGRGSYTLSEKSSLSVQQCRERVAHFIHASAEQIIFTKGTTESINLVANSFYSKLTSHDSNRVTQMKHHANLLPWQR